MWFAELASSVTREAWNSVVLSAILICGCRSTAIPPLLPTAFVLYTFVYFVPTTWRYIASLLQMVTRCIVINCFGTYRGYWKHWNSAIRFSRNILITNRSAYSIYLIWHSRSWKGISRAYPQLSDILRSNYKNPNSSN